MNSQPLTILVASPDRDLLRRLTKFLEAFGYGVRQAADGQQALAAAQAARPDYLLLDASGPAGSNAQLDLQLCRQVRRTWPGGYTFSLLLTNQPEPATITAALEAGFDDFLASPVVFGELLARLRAGARVIEFERRLAEQSGFDDLTNLPHRGALAARLQSLAAEKASPAGWLAIFDLDFFSRLADHNGRAAAASILKKSAQIIQLRAAAPALAVALGEDQFAVILPAGGEEPSHWAQTVLSALAEQSLELAGQAVRITASCGLTAIQAGEPLDVVLARCQRAVQLAKASGRNCVATSEQLDRDSQAWTSFAAGGKLFHTTTARDVMQPCPLLLSADESADQAAALLTQTGLTSAPVVDAEGRLAGLITAEQLDKVKSRRDARSKNSSSVRLVRHVMSAEVVKFDETTPLSQLLEHFTDGGADVAIVVRDRRPRGIVLCQGLAALNEKLVAGHFAPTTPPSQTSADLLVPELALAE
jgi:diguanylate cyclase (GGDEF)-like protein